MQEGSAVDLAEFAAKKEMQQTLGIREIRHAMDRVVYRSSDWHALCLVLCQKLCMEGDYKKAAEYLQKIDGSKLAAEYRPNYHTALAGIADKEGKREKSIEELKIARELDRALPQPTQQFVLTKQIAWAYDFSGRQAEAVLQWEALIEDFKSFEHSEHQPMLAYKFLSQTLIKIGKVQEAEEARLRWVNDRVTDALNSHNSKHFKSSNPPDNYDDELSNFFERSRQNVFHLYAHEKKIVNELRLRNAQFWVGSQSMRVQMADLQEGNGGKHLSDKEQLPYFLYMRAISTYLTATELAAGGRIPEAYGALRMCLENSFYAFHLSEKSEHAETWLDRPKLSLGEVDAAKKAKRKAIADAFAPGKIISDITDKSNDIGQKCRYYYEMCIDEGAHPNVNVFKKQASQRTDNSGYVFGLDFLTPGLSVTCCKNILSAAKVAIEVFRLGQWIW